MSAVDMSPKAISKRLQQVSDLRDVCFFLGGSRIQKPWDVDSIKQKPQVAREPAAVYRTKQDGLDLERTPG